MSDDTFNDSDWKSSIQQNAADAPSSFVAGQVASGGNPGAFRRVTHRLPRVIGVAHINTTERASFQGGIASLDYDFDLANFSVPNPASSLPVSYYLALTQESPAGDTYYVSSPSNVIPEGSGWIHYGRKGLTPANFGKVSGPGPANPDFASSGGKIHFGYYTSNSNNGPSTLETISGIDNWMVTITPGESCLSLRGQPRTFFETTWAGTWTPTVFTQGAGGTSNAVAGSDNVAGSFLRVNISAGVGTTTNPANVWAFFENANAVYDPRTNGAIASVSYCEDVKFFQGFGQGQGTGPALRQGGKVYVAPSGVTGLPANWTTLSRSGLTAASFFQMNGPGGFTDGGSHPDFSAGGLPITFGFMRANSSVADAYQTSIGIDNWLIAVKDISGDGASQSLTTTTASPLPNAKLGLPYSQALAAAGGAPPYTWAVAAGALPAGLTLNASSGLVNGTPTASGTFQFTARATDSASASATKAFALTVDIPTPSCAITPQNMVIGDHRPGWHLSPAGRSRDHRVSLSVVVDGAPGRNLDVAVVANKIAFSSSPSELPNLTRTVVRTDDTGTVSFAVNPPRPVTFDQTDFEATGSVGARTFRCTGSVTAGLGTLSAVTTSSTAETATAVSALAQEIGGSIFGPIFRALLPGTGSRSPTVAAPRPAEPRILEFRPNAAREAQAVIAHVRKNLGPSVASGTRATAALDAAPAVRGDAKPATETAAASLRERYANLPLSFERNQGQFDSRIRFMSRAEGYEVHLAEREAWLVDRSAGAAFASTVRIQFSGANPSPSMIAREKLPGVSHYLSGNDAHANVPHYASVIYRQAYPGVDLVFHGRRRQLQLDFIVAPRARPDRITLEFGERNRLELSDQGDLLVHHAGGRVRLERPFVYQQKASGARQPVQGRYVLKGENRAGFEVAAYDADRSLVIDPVISFASYIGGGGAEAGTAIAVDAQGNAYITGGTGSANFPTMSAIQPVLRGPALDVFVTKLNSTGTAVLYSTYIGGVGIDMGLGIAVDSTGSAYVTGMTQSPDFPLVQAVQRAPGGSVPAVGDAFVFKLDPSGSKLVYSTYLGGGQQDMGRAIAVDAAGNAYVAGSTASADFPVKNAFQAVHRGTGPIGTDAFVAKLNSAGTDLVYSTYLGGPGASIANAIALDAAGNAYVTGGTDSAGFPTVAAFQSSNKGSQDAFVSKLNAAGNVVYSTYLGGESDDMGMGIAMDASGSAYVTGFTGSAGFPVQAPAQAKPGAASLLGLDAFVTKLSADGSRLVYSTYLGGSGVDVGVGIAVGSDGSAYVAGETTSVDFPAVNALQPAPAGSTEAFVARLNPAGSSVSYSTTLGGIGHDSAAGIAFHPSGVYVVGTSMSADFPATYGAYQAISRGSADARVVKIVEGTPVPRFSGISGATFRLSEALASDAIVAGFGEALAPGIQPAQTTPLPTNLLGVSVRVKDAAGREEAAPLFFVSPRQINFTVPAGLANGLAAVTVVREGQTVATGTLRIESVAPGLFSANADGKGVAAAVALRVAADGTQEPRIIFECGTAAGSCAPVPIEMGADTDQMFLLLFGTGIRGRSSLSAVTATVGGEPVPVLAAGAQGEFAGLDQVNIGPLPRTLAGRGRVDIMLTIDRKKANTVSMAVK